MSDSPGLVETAEGGDRLATLRALRDDLARSIVACESLRDKASLGRLLKDVLADIEAIPNKAEVSAADEIAARRAARRSNSAASSRA